MILRLRKIRVGSPDHMAARNRKSKFLTREISKYNKASQGNSHVEFQSRFPILALNEGLGSESLDGDHQQWNLSCSCGKPTVRMFFFSKSEPRIKRSRRSARSALLDSALLDTRLYMKDFVKKMPKITIFSACGAPKSRFHITLCQKTFLSCSVVFFVF